VHVLSIADFLYVDFFLRLQTVLEKIVSGKMLLLKNHSFCIERLIVFPILSNVKSVIFPV